MDHEFVNKIFKLFSQHLSIPITQVPNQVLYGHTKLCLGILGFVWYPKTFSVRSPELQTTLYKTIVRPKLEYCNAVLSPHLLGDINSKERVQRNSAGMISNLRNRPYESVCNYPKITIAQLQKA